MNDPMFNHGAVKPLACLNQGLQLLSGQYWLFFGVVAVALIIGSAVPMGILLGPMMCGMSLCFLAKYDGKQVQFATLFKGFDYFARSLVPWGAMVAISLVILLPVYGLMFLAMFTTLVAGAEGQVSQAGSPVVIITIFVVGILLAMLVNVVSMFVIFAFPLLVDRETAALDSVTLSFRATLANFWGLFALYLINCMLGAVGMLACYIGVFFVLPISFASNAVAYRHIFPALNTPTALADDDEPTSAMHTDATGVNPYQSQSFDASN